MAASMDLHIHGCLHGPVHPWLPPRTYTPMAASMDPYAASMDLHIHVCLRGPTYPGCLIGPTYPGCLRGPTYPWLPRSVQCEPVWPSGKAGKRQRDLGSNPLRLSFLFKDYGLWTLS